MRKDSHGGIKNRKRKLQQVKDLANAVVRLSGEISCPLFSLNTN